eukprot:914388_1
MKDNELDVVYFRRDDARLSKHSLRRVQEIQYTSHDDHRNCELIVDIMCDDGLRWIKVKTSNPYSMQLQFLNSGTTSKAKNIITMADNFLCASAQHQVYFSSPKIEE